MNDERLRRAPGSRLDGPRCYPRRGSRQRRAEGDKAKDRKHEEVHGRLLVCRWFG